jgi:hypothetical protein
MTRNSVHKQHLKLKVSWVSMKLNKNAVPIINVQEIKEKKLKTRPMRKC